MWKSAIVLLVCFQATWSCSVDRVAQCTKEIQEDIHSIQPDKFACSVLIKMWKCVSKIPDCDEEFMRLQVALGRKMMERMGVSCSDPSLPDGSIGSCDIEKYAECTEDYQKNIQSFVDQHKIDWKTGFCSVMTDYETCLNQKSGCEKKFLDMTFQMTKDFMKTMSEIDCS